METIYNYLKQQVELHPDALAVFDEHRSLTFNELDKMASQIAANFPGEPKRIGVVMNHGVEMIASLFAILKIGAAYVPVEPSFPTDRIRFMMNECNVDFVLTATAVRNEFHPAPGDVMLQYSVCSFDIFVEEVFASLLSGAALAIPPEEAKNDIRLLMKFVEENHVTIISGFPYLLLEMNKLKAIPKSLRLLISGGDVVRESYIDKLLPQVEVYNTYGPSETTVCASYFRCNGTQALPDGTYPIGKAVKGVSIKLLDEQMNPVLVGKIGEICIFGNGVSHGYVGKRENEAFVTLPDGQRMYRSGDLAIMQPDGNLLFLHRKDTQVMILGRRVEPAEVQNILCECHDVEKGAVYANTDEQGLSYLTAYVVPKNKKRFSMSAVKKAMTKFLPPYMIPEFFVRMEAMPVTPNGKVNGEALPIVMKSGSL